MTTEERLSAVEARLDDISRQLQILVDAQRPLLELRDEAGTIVKDVMRTSVDQLAFMEERGYFAFVRELKYLVDRVVEDYDPADLHALADNAANILDTVRGLTQPAVMEVARAAADAFADERREPVGLLGVARALNRDKNIQRGLSFGLDVLARVGRAVSRAPRMSRKALAPVAQSPEHRPVKVHHHEDPPQRPTRAPAPAASGTDDSRYIPSAEWSRDVALQIASDLGLGPLSDAQFELVTKVRHAYEESGATPNIRKITVVAGIATRDVYGLFPTAPAKTIARIAGVPKPIGCL